MKKAIATALLVSVILSAEVWGVSSEYERQTLRGLQGIWVVVEDLPPEVERRGLTREKILSDVEQKLRGAGIKLLNRNMCIVTPGRPQLYVNVRTFKPGEANGYAYYNSIDLRQVVDLERNQLRTFSPTWSRYSAGIVSENQLDLIRDDMRQMVDVFVDTWLTVNR